jgi:hypothetical protein
MKRRVTTIHIAAMVILWLFVGFASFTDQRTMACLCGRPGSPSEELQRNDAVFSGEVISRDFKSAKVEFNVEKFWKGSRRRKFRLNT